MSKQRRTYTAQFKLETVLEALRGEKSVVQICRKRGIKDSLYYSGEINFKSKRCTFSGRKRHVQTRSKGNGSRSWNGWWDAWR